MEGGPGSREYEVKETEGEFERAVSARKTLK
jgi:hypothetical protein